MPQERQREIRELFSEYIQMYALRDDRLTTRFSQNFTGFTGSGVQLIQDRDELIRIIRQDFKQVPDHIRIEVIDVSLQDLCAEVASVAATVRIHLPNNADLLANHVTRVVLVFRLEAGAWMITHCSYSVPFHSASDDEVYPISSLQQQNRAFQELVAERTRALQESRTFYRMLTEDAEDVHWQMDRNYIVTYISPADERLRGFHASEVVGRPVFEFLSEEAGKRLREVINPSLQSAPSTGHTNVGKFEMQHLCKDGSVVWGEVQVKPEQNDKGEVIGYHGITRNITERKRLEKQVQQLAFHDTLTNLANRRLLQEHLEQAMGESKRSHYYGAVIYMDLDNFKPLNDVYGHGLGDLLLIEVGSRLKGCVRAVDTVARIGGDEFVALLRSLSQKQEEACEQAMAVAEKIRSCLAERYVLRPAPDASAIEHACTASIGVALFRGRDETQDSLMQRADHAMYQAKQNGRNRVLLAQDAKK